LPIRHKQGPETGRSQQERDRAAARHHILNIRRIETDPLLKPVQNLSQAALRVYVAQGTDAGFAPASG